MDAQKAGLQKHTLLRTSAHQWSTAIYRQADTSATLIRSAHPVIDLPRNAQPSFNVQLQPIQVSQRHGSAAVQLSVLLVLRRRRCHDRFRGAAG